jgi:hypothetical protein
MQLGHAVGDGLLVAIAAAGIAHRQEAKAGWGRPPGQRRQAGRHQRHQGRAEQRLQQLAAGAANRQPLLARSAWFGAQHR